MTYLDTCSKTASVLPLACRELCHDKNEDHCLEYLRTDLSIQCHDSRYNNLAIIAYLSTVYVLALPVATFIILWRKRKDILMMADGEEGDNQRLGSEVTMGLIFLFENYKGTSWYWEFVEMSRKVIITSGLILIGQESRSYIGLAWVIAGIYGVLFAWNHPIQYVVLGPRKSPMPLICVFSENDKISRQEKNTLNNERYRDLLISILSYDEVSVFSLRVKTRN